MAIAKQWDRIPKLPPNPTPPEPPERWSAPRKQEVVLRLIRGEPLHHVSRETQVPTHELESWHRRFLEAGQQDLRSRGDPEERELTVAKAKIGARMMRLELAEGLIEKRGVTDEWKRSRR